MRSQPLYKNKQIGFSSNITVTKEVLSLLSSKKANKVRQYCQKALKDGKTLEANIGMNRDKFTGLHIRENGFKIDFEMRMPGLYADVKFPPERIIVNAQPNFIFKKFPVAAIKRMIKLGKKEQNPTNRINFISLGKSWLNKIKLTYGSWTNTNNSAFMYAKKSK